MTAARKIVFYHAPHTRSAMTRVLLEELGVPYDLHVLDFPGGEHRTPAYLAVSPMGKLPAIAHGDAIVTESVAIFIYLADLFPESKLAPAPTDPLRGPYLRWLVFYAGCFEPALMDKSMNREPPPLSRSPYGDYDSVIKTLNDQLAKGPYICGDTFTAADVLWGAALAWTTMFKLVPLTPVIEDYIKRVTSRPAAVRAREKDEALVAARK